MSRIWRASGIVLLLATTAAWPDVDLGTSGISAPAGSGVSIPVNFTANGDAISVVVLRALYDDSLLTPLLVSRGAVASAANKSVAFNASNGVLSVSVSGGDTMLGDGLLFEIVFVIDPSATAGVPLSVSEGGSDAATPDAVLVDAAMAGFSITPLANTGQHAADSDGDWSVSLSEILRIIQFFNSDSYHCEPGTEDGYAPSLGAQDCLPHDSDYNAQDWAVNLSELLRAIQIYNTAEGYYHTDGGGEDGFAPGPFMAP